MVSPGFSRLCERCGQPAGRGSVKYCGACQVIVGSQKRAWFGRPAYGRVKIVDERADSELDADRIRSTEGR